MLISELIEFLDNKLEEYGDLPVNLNSGAVEEYAFAVYDIDGYSPNNSGKKPHELFIH